VDECKPLPDTVSATAFCRVMRSKAPGRHRPWRGVNVITTRHVTGGHLKRWRWRAFILLLDQLVMNHAHLLGPSPSTIRN